MLQFWLRFIFVFCTFVSFAFAANGKWYSAKPLSFYVELPSKKTDQWLVGPAIGFPLVVLSPVENGYRRTMSLTPEMTASKMNVSLDDMKKEELIYQNGRKKYVSDRKGEVHEFLPIEKVKNDHGLEIFRLGYIYSIGGLKIVEYSYRFTCQNNVVAAMERYYPKHHKNGMKDYQKIWRTLRCKTGEAL